MHNSPRPHRSGNTNSNMLKPNKYKTTRESPKNAVLKHLCNPSNNGAQYDCNYVYHLRAVKADYVRVPNSTRPHSQI